MFQCSKPGSRYPQMPSELLKRGVTEMNRKALLLILMSLLLTGASTAFACEYKAGETKFLDYAICAYGEDAVEEVALPEEAVWDKCIYKLEAFRPPKLLAVTKDNNGNEVASINDRRQIGNPCYLTKQQCDAALEASGF